MIQKISEEEHEKYQKFVKSIDSSLDFDKCFIRLRDGNFVFRVKDGGDFYTLKGTSDDLEYIPYYYNESLALKNTIGIKGFVKLIENYGVVNESGILLKSYAKGYHPQKEIKCKILRKGLRETVKKAHEKGVTINDIRECNVILRGKRATIIDLDQAKVYRNLNSQKFLEQKQKDLCDLENLFSWKND